MKAGAESFPRAVCWAVLSQQAINDSAAAVAGGSQLCHWHSCLNNRGGFSLQAFTTHRKTKNDFPPHMLQSTYFEKKRITYFPASKIKPPQIEQVLNALSNVMRNSKDLRCEMTFRWVDQHRFYIRVSRGTSDLRCTKAALWTGTRWQSHHQRKRIKAFSASFFFPPTLCGLNPFSKALC